MRGGNKSIQTGERNIQPGKDLFAPNSAPSTAMKKIHLRVFFNHLNMHRYSPSQSQPRLSSIVNTPLIWHLLTVNILEVCRVSIQTINTVQYLLIYHNLFYYGLVNSIQGVILFRLSPCKNHENRTRIKESGSLLNPFLVLHTREILSSCSYSFSILPYERIGKRFGNDSKNAESF